MRNAAAAFLIAVIAGGMIGAARAEVPARPPFVATLSNHAPLAFGMNPADVANALRTALVYVGGGRHNEIYRAERTINGGIFFPRRDQIYLQFRHGRLTGWKGDWNLDATWR